MTRARSYGSKAVSRQYGVTMAMTTLLQRDNLDTLDLAGFSRMFGLKPAQAETLLSDERMRRAANGR